MKKYLFFFCLMFSLGVFASEQAAPVKVSRVRSLNERQRTVPITGFLQTQRISKLSSQVDAFADQVLVEEGDNVNKGQVLLHLDSVIAEFELQKSLAALEEAKAQLKENQRLKDELGKLIQNQYMAKTSYETAVSEVKIKSAIVKRLQAEVALNKELIRQHKIKAPFDGVITEKYVEAGQWIKVAEPTLELIDNDHLRVKALVPQNYFSKISTQTQVLIYPDPSPDTPLTAKISNIVPLAGMSAHTFPIYIDVDNSARNLAAGMSVRIEMLLTEAKPLLALPRDAIVKKSNQINQVWRIKVQGKETKAYPVEVQTGQVIGAQIEILDGKLKPGDQVVVRGNEALKPGQHVRIIP